VAGARGARRGLCQVVASLGSERTWTQAAAEYRKLLYAAGAPKALGPDGRPVRRSFTEAQVAAVARVGRFVRRCGGGRTWTAAAGS
jgi:hypothetical protein